MHRLAVGAAAVVLLAAALVLPTAADHPGDGMASAAFGAPGHPHFDHIPLPEGLPGVEGSGEPTIGIPWDTDHVFFQAYVNTYRCDFGAVNGTMTGETPSVPCVDVTPAFTRNPVPGAPQPNLDPMLHADPVSGRIFAGGLAGPCSLMGISDDDGASWTPAGNMCSGHQLDHQTIGSGPWSASAPETPGRDLVADRAVYYCSQGALLVIVGPAGAACATSLDGGRTWQPFTQVLGGCGGFHGHIKVSELTGFAVLPFARCGNEVGYAYTSDNGRTWNSVTFPGSRIGDAIGFDPSVAFSYESGWMYYALANDVGMHVALSKDDGATWETLGNNTPGVAPSTYLNLANAYHDPATGRNLTFTTFTNVVAGDDLRAAVAFMGTTNEGDNPFTDCDDDAKELVWHYYLASTFDGGATWTVERVSEDPVQVGGIWDGGGGVDCRNLLDFNDADIDSQGRIYIGFADGCTGECAETYLAGGKPTPDDSRSEYGTVLRQATGRGMFAATDVAEPEGNTTTTTTGGANTTQVPAPAFWMGVTVLAAAVLLRRR